LLSRDSYNVIDPAKLKKGNIVEAQISLLVVPIKNKKFKPLIVLRAITLLDDQLTRVSQVINQHKRYRADTFT